MVANRSDRSRAGTMTKGKDTLASNGSGFWDRQFTGEPTGSQIFVDVMAGVVLPLVCLFFDPIVFQTSFDRPLLAGFRTVGWLAIGAEYYRWSCGSRSGEPRDCLWGFWPVAHFFALVLGLILIPYSLIGLIVLIGLLGFTPSLTAFVFLRNCCARIFRLRKRMRPRDDRDCDAGLRCQ